MSLYLRVKSVLYRMSQSPAGVRGGVATFESAHVDQLLLTRPVIVVYTCRIARPVVPRLGIQNTRLKRQTQTAGGAHASTRVEALKLAQVDVLLRAQTSIFLFKYSTYVSRQSSRRPELGVDE